ncbi:MAG: dihydrodipicolinate synthase family protein, partial [Gemmatimonadetes bacterium]|nr:dihydrodipicolinate synthase family protein [Gemmatimonadota bacterium]
VGCGAHGLVYPVNASGFSTLTDEERLRGARIVVEQNAGRIPVVVGVAGLCAEHAAMFSREAKGMGGDAVIAMTPYVNKLRDEELIVDYYRAIADAAELPVFIQNHGVGSELSVGTMVRILREVEHVEYIKEETMPATHKLSQVLREAGDDLKGVFGGAGGRFLLLEHPRGVAGQMPGCHITDVVVRLWNALEAGELAEAKRIFGMMGPIFAIEVQYPGVIYKEVLCMRGVTQSARARHIPDSLDEEDRRALKEIMDDLEPLLMWRG